MNQLPPWYPDILSLFEPGTELHFEKGQTIIYANDENKYVYLITDGMVKTFSLNNRGEEYLHILYGPGDFFPITWLLSTRKQNIFMQAITKCTVHRMPSSDLKRLVKENGAASLAMLQQTSWQFMVYTNRIDNLEFKYASERLAYRLLLLAMRFGRQEGDVYALPPITQHDIARSINLSRESTNREIERLTQKGIIGHQGRRITIKNIEELHKELHADVLTNIWSLDI